MKTNAMVTDRAISGDLRSEIGCRGLGLSRGFKDFATCDLVRFGKEVLPDPRGMDELLISIRG